MSNTPNTRVLYMYRDASNYKLYAQEILRRALTVDEQNEFNEQNAGLPFYPEKVGLPFLKFQDHYDDDPDWMEIVCLAATTADATVDITVQDFVERLKDPKVRPY